jgi:hypothetical protein
VTDNGTRTSRASVAQAKHPSGSGKTPVPGRPGHPTYSPPVLGTYDKKVKFKKEEAQTVIPHGRASTAAPSRKSRGK